MKNWKARVVYTFICQKIKTTSIADNFPYPIKLELVKAVKSKLLRSVTKSIVDIMTYAIDIKHDFHVIKFFIGIVFLR